MDEQQFFSLLRAIRNKATVIVSKETFIILMEHLHSYEVSAQHGDRRMVSGILNSKGWELLEKEEALEVLKKRWDLDMYTPVRCVNFSAMLGSGIFIGVRDTYTEKSARAEVYIFSLRKMGNWRQMQTTRHL